MYLLTELEAALPDVTTDVSHLGYSEIDTKLRDWQTGGAERKAAAKRKRQEDEGDGGKKEYKKRGGGGGGGGGRHRAFASSV